MGQHLEVPTRLLVGTPLASLIGYERHLHGRPAGLRTHLLVGLASTTLPLIPSRIAASVVTGVGFLGGGAILRTGLSVQQLTTAAGLWLVAAIGLSAGAGMYTICVASTALGITALRCSAGSSTRRGFPDNERGPSGRAGVSAGSPKSADRTVALTGLALDRR